MQTEGRGHCRASCERRAEEFHDRRLHHHLRHQGDFSRGATYTLKRPRMMAAPRPHRGAPGPDDGAYPATPMRIGLAVAAAVPLSVACYSGSMLRREEFFSHGKDRECHGTACRFGERCLVPRYAFMQEDNRAGLLRRELHAFRGFVFASGRVLGLPRLALTLAGSTPMIPGRTGGKARLPHVFLAEVQMRRPRPSAMSFTPLVRIRRSATRRARCTPRLTPPRSTARL